MNPAYHNILQIILVIWCHHKNTWKDWPQPNTNSNQLLCSNHLKTHTNTFTILVHPATMKKKGKHAGLGQKTIKEINRFHPFPKRLLNIVQTYPRQLTKVVFPKREVRKDEPGGEPQKFILNAYQKPLKTLENHEQKLKTKKTCLHWTKPKKPGNLLFSLPIFCFTFSRLPRTLRTDFERFSKRIRRSEAGAKRHKEVQWYFVSSFLEV